METKLIYDDCPRCPYECVENTSGQYYQAGVFCPICRRLREHYMKDKEEKANGIYTIRFTEWEEREWYIEVEAESAENAGELFEACNENVRSMVDSKNAKWAAGSNEDGEVVDTYKTDWEVENVNRLRSPSGLCVYSVG